MDFALDTMSGYEFVQHLGSYLERIGKSLGGVGRIKKNPEKSKHLETATCQFLGMEMDFSNLRQETYTRNSRIPVIVSTF